MGPTKMARPGGVGADREDERRRPGVAICHNLTIDLAGQIREVVLIP